MKSLTQYIEQNSRASSLDVYIEQSSRASSLDVYNIKENKSESYFSADFENPNKEGCKIIQKFLEENKLMPSGKPKWPVKSSCRNYKWLIDLYNDRDIGLIYVLKYTYTKGKDTYYNRIAEFYDNAISPTQKGGVLIEPANGESDKIKFEFVKSIADKLGFEWNNKKSVFTK